MSVQFRLYQNNNKNSDYYKKWYGRAVSIETVGIDKLAEQIEANCTVKRADVLAVLSELVVVMKQELHNSKRVKLDHFGSFKIGINTVPADEKKDFSASSNIRNVRVIFQPEVKVSNTGRRVKNFTEGCKFIPVLMQGDTQEEPQEEPAA